MNKDTFNLIKMFPLQANIEDIEWLCDEVERLREGRDTFVIGQYKIQQFHEGNYWIKNAAEEGMEVSKETLENLIDRFFSENF